MNTTLLQPLELMLYFYSGLICGFVLLVIHLFQRRARSRRIRDFGDAAAVLICGSILALSFYYANGGSFRLFGLLGMLMGAGVFHWSIGAYILQFVNKHDSRFSS